MAHPVGDPPSLVEMVRLDRELERCARDVDAALEARNFAALRLVLKRRRHLRARRDQLMPKEP